MSSFHVLIAGGGIGGLCLAQGLKRAGISCAVYEAAAEIVHSGYRLHMNALGGEALRACLPDNLYELYLQTSRRTPEREMSVMLDIHGGEIWTRPHIGPPNEGPRPHTAVNRRTLRQILATGLDDVLHFGQTAVEYEADDDEVRLLLDDGSSAVGDVLVGADGIHSVIRSQLLPEVDVIDTGMRGMWSIAPLTDDLAEVMPAALFDGFAIVTRGDGTISAIGVYDPRRPIAEAVADLAPGAEIGHVDPYVMVTYGSDLGAERGPALPDFANDSPAELHDAIRRAMQGAHPGLVELVERIDESTISPSAIRYLEVADPWPPSRVTLLGDAIHAMPPSFGAGANSALRDAACLVRSLEDAVHGRKPLLEAISEYEGQMRAEVFPIMRASADPDAVHSDHVPDLAG
ncbi:FAD-dependent monooxygenase [Microbacterium sp. 4R-513]|uniref:FAD-dependent oxidoreductase n=1 Tax=Microbacterium sp. 4R-513 TaxID=2567934 RepID=UPI0013E1DA97|nr:NAD(P)/FAD-dependent oxidoreductase [Microbacterium sp. 4R-513]QIG39447.1 FAD-dependent monooxygenase [Microbacterium sp. 4R-513]